MIALILKWLSQLLMLAVGIPNVVRAHSVLRGSTRRNPLTAVGWVNIAALLIGFSFFVATDIKERSENLKKDAAQQKTIAELQEVNQQLTKIGLDRDLSGIEISFKPTVEHWSRIAKMYSKIESPVPGIPYSAATMKAESSEGHWKIDFDPVSRPEATIRFPQVLPNQPNAKAFEDVIHEASIALWIKWGADLETELEPLRYQYPSAISISQDRIALTLRPPETRVNLNYLRANPTMILRGRNDASSLRFRSLDLAVTLDQTIDMQWRKEDIVPENDVDTYIRRIKPYVSGPHRLQITFRASLNTVAPSASLSILNRDNLSSSLEAAIIGPDLRGEPTLGLYHLNNITLKSVERTFTAFGIVQ